MLLVTLHWIRLVGRMKPTKSAWSVKFLGGVFCLQFKRNEKGLLDENGEYSKKDLIKMNVKCKKEGPFGLGCAKVRCKNNDPNSPHVAVVMTPFDCSGRVIVYIPDYKTKINQGICRVKNLSAKLKWCKKNIDEIFQDNKVDKLNGIGAKTMQKLNEAGFFNMWGYMQHDGGSI